MCTQRNNIEFAQFKLNLSFPIVPLCKAIILTLGIFSHMVYNQ